ncbi:MAG TPA: ABC transporter permease, partial [Terriglobales bacterium]
MKPPNWKQSEEEIAHHLELEARKRGDQRRAEAAFGGVDRVLEECRDQRRWTWLQDFGRDLTFGLRRLRRTPGFALIAVATLALGIGANTALFTLVNTVLLRSLPVPHAEQLVLLGNPDFSGVEIGTSDHDVDALTYTQYSRLRQQNQVFSGVLAAAAEELTIRIGPADGGSAEAGPIAGVEMVSANYFDVLEVHPERGRFFDPVEDTSAAAPEVVISDGFWRSEFHGDPGMVGRTLKMRSTVFTVVGVAPAGFGGISVGFVPDIYAPLQLQQRVWPGRDLLHDPPSIRRASWLLALGRLKPGATAAQAKADCNLIFGQTVREQAALASDAQNKADLLTQRLPVSAGGRGASALREQFGKPLWLLFALVGVVLLVVAVNLGGMLLAQASTREREFAMRLALGARRSRLVRQLLTESLMLAAAGGVSGFWLARLGESALVGLVATPDSGLSLLLSSDWHVMVFTAAICLLVGIGFGMTPALRLARTQLNVKSEHRRVPAANALVVAQVALSIVLVTGAALFVRSLDQLRQVHLGYSPVNLVTFNVNAVAGGASGAVAVDMYQKITDAVAHLPGVKGATFSENGLFSGRESGDGVKVEGYTGSESPSAAMDKVAPGYFAQLGVPVLLGREFTAADRSRALKPVIVDQAFVNHYFQHVNPLGKLVT